MASEDAPDLEAIRERMDPLIETLAFLIGNSAALDLKALLTAYDVQAARLAKLAALEAAARALEGDHAAYARGAITRDVWEACRRLGVGRIIMAVRALTTPPEETP